MMRCVGVKVNFVIVKTTNRKQYSTQIHILAVKLSQINNAKTTGPYLTHINFSYEYAYVAHN